MNVDESQFSIFRRASKSNSFAAFFTLTLCLSLAPSLHSAGVTIVTHGFSLLPGQPGWVAAMGDYVADRANAAGGSASIYEVVVAKLNPLDPLDQSVYVESFTLQQGTPTAANANGEIVVKLYWDKVANPESAGSFLVTTKDVAAAVFPYLSVPNAVPGLTTALAELPIHLIGHSRGGSLVAELARLLGQRGIWVDQLTLLDPHPVCGDAPVNIYENVGFADNYYQALQGSPWCYALDPSGFYVIGAYNRQLMDLDGGYTGPAGAHQNVHLWYHGTLNLDPAASDGDQTFNATMRQNWWYPSELMGARTGYYFSRIADGDRYTIAPAVANTSDPVSFGVNPKLRNPSSNDYGPRVGFQPGERDAIQWPNIVSLEQDAQAPVLIGDPVIIQYAYQSYSDPVTVTIGLDTNQNPYDGDAGVTVATKQLNATGDLVGWDTVPWYTTGVSAGSYYVYAKITSKTANALVGNRYLYSSRKVTLVARGTGSGSLTLLAAPTLLSPSNGATGQFVTPTFNWSSVDGATSYRIMVATSATALPTDPTDGTCPACLLNSTITANSYSITNAILSFGTTYYWQVHARSQDYFGHWSSPFSFVTFSQAPGEIISGQTVADFIDVPHRTNRYTFTASAGDNLLLSLVKTNSASSLVPYLEVYGPDGSFLTDNGGMYFGSVVPQISKQAAQSGTYSILVEDWSGTHTGGYNLRLVKFPGAQLPDPAGDGAAIVSGQVRTGSIDLGDMDVYRFSASAGDNFLLRLTKTNSASSLYPYLAVYGPDGTLVTWGGGSSVASVSKQAGQSGTYSVLVEDENGTGTGGYNLRLVKFPGAQLTDPAGDGGAIVSGQMRTGAIDLGAMDEYTFTASAGDNLLLSLVKTNSASSLVPYLEVYGPDGSFLTDNGGMYFGSVVPQISKQAAQSGTYSILVEDWSGTHTGGYNLRLVKFPGAQLPDPAGDGGAIVSGQTRTGSIDVGDMDVYTFTASAGDNLLLTLAKTKSTSSLYPYLAVYEPDGSLVTWDGGSPVASVSKQAGQSGTYSVLVEDENGAGTGGYNLRLVKFPGAQLLDPTGEGGAIVSGQTRTGSIDPGDMDVYTFTTAVGCNFILSAAKTNSASSLYPYLLLYGPDGSLVTSGQGNPVAQISQRAQQNGTYSVLVEDYWGSGTGGYNLLLAKFPGAQLPDPTGEGGPIVSGQTRTGTIDLGDMDVYNFTAAVGDNFILSAAKTNSASSLYPYLLLYGPDGSLVTSGQGNPTAQISQRAQQNGTYSVLVEDYWGSGTGGYNLLLAKFPGAQLPDPTGEGGPIVSGQTRTGTIDLGDMDVYTFTAAVGDNFILSAAKTNSANSLYPYLLLYGPDGSLVTSGQGNPTAQISQRAQQNGTYSVLVEDYWGSGTGGYQLTISGIAASKTTPVVTWNNPSNIIYGTALSGAQLNASANVPGTFQYFPPTGTVLYADSNQTLTVTFTPNDSAHYTLATAVVTLNVLKADQTISFAPVGNRTVGASISLTAAASSGLPVGFAVIAGPAIVSSSNALTLTSTGTVTIRAYQAGDVNYNPAPDVTQSFTVGNVTPVILWTNPPDITYGTALSTNQLNARANVPGSLTYSPPAGSVLNAGSNQQLTATFNPTDWTEFTTATKSVNLNVNKAVPVITWASPADITYGTALSATQLNATANVAGSFAYSPLAGTVLNAGSNWLAATFTPTDSTNYTSASAGVTLNVAQATPQITWANPAAITYGTTLSTNQLNAAANVPGTFAYNPAAGTKLNSGAGQILSVTLTPADTTNYTTASKTVVLTVAKAAPQITWANPAAITYGTTLGTTQLNATADVPGTFAYNPAAGTRLNSSAGQSLSVTFTPTDTTNYTTAAAGVSLNVLKAGLTLAGITAANKVYDGTTTATVNTSSTTLNGVLASDAANVGLVASGATGAFADKNVGTGKLVTISGVALSGGAATNYTLTQPTTVANITPAALTVTADNKSRADGTANPVFTGTLTGLVTNDNITATYNCSATTNSPPGTYAIVPTLVDPAGRLVNYTVTINNGTLTVINTPRVVSNLPNTYTNQVPFTVTLSVAPPSATMLGVVQDQPPAGWAVANISDSGTMGSGKVTWILTGDSPRTLSYVVIPPASAVGTNDFAGEASFDGTTRMPITGVRECIAAFTPARLSLTLVKLLDVTFVKLKVSGQSGKVYQIQVASSLAAIAQWQTITTVTLDNSAKDWTDPTPVTQTNRFYRALPLP